MNKAGSNLQAGCGCLCASVGKSIAAGAQNKRYHCTESRNQLQLMTSQLSRSPCEAAAAWPGAFQENTQLRLPCRRVGEPAALRTWRPPDLPDFS